MVRRLEIGTPTQLSYHNDDKDTMLTNLPVPYDLEGAFSVIAKTDESFAAQVCTAM